MIFSKTIMPGQVIITVFANTVNWPLLTIHHLLHMMTAAITLYVFWNIWLKYWVTTHSELEIEFDSVLKFLSNDVWL